MNNYDNWKLATPYDVNSNNLESFEEDIKITGIQDTESSYHQEEWELFTDELRALCKKYNYKTNL